MQALLKEINEQLARLSEALGSGMCKDMSEYSLICGQIMMLKQFKDYTLQAIEKQDIAEENIDV